VPERRDLSDHTPWLDSRRRSRGRRLAALRAARRRRWSLRSGLGVALASLTVAAGGALAQTGTGGAAAPSASSSASARTIMAVQRALGITADGIAGPQTRRAIKRFQRTHGLTVDGVIGPATLGALGISATPAKASLDAVRDPSAELAKIAACESGGNPTAISPSGRYRGKYQFTRATWAWLGGTGDPAKAPEATQDAMAAKLLALRGTAPWPVCG
jgi:peptidoglycan hydrolase-like protein with peptidoglycan-binding domain